jgi:simple sugar transport system substrate-binding protein
MIPTRSAKGRALGRSRKGLTLTALAAAALLALSACSGGGAPPQTQQTEGGGGGGDSGYTIAMVTHEAPGDTFWDKIRAGAEQAAKDTGADLKYSANPSVAEEATLIQNAIDSKVDGIATTVYSDALAGAMKNAQAAKIPLVGFNTGIDIYKDLGALMYFGSDEDLAGQTAGKRIADEGAKHALCVIQEEGSVALEARCAGVKKSLANTENIQVNGRDVASVTSSLQAKLSQDKSIDYIVTLGAPIALAALQSIDQSSSSAKLVTFDLNTDAAQAIKDGKIQFSIDQQPYVQGYMAVTSLYLYLKNGNDIGGGQPVLTGPSFVDQSNIDTILPYAQNNTR